MNSPETTDASELSQAPEIETPKITPVRTPPSDRYYLAATVILIIGIVLRQWALSSASYHPDEAIHSFFSEGFATYKYNPTYHGPLLYHLTAVVFGLFGVNEFTARIVPSLLGIGLIAMILGPLRHMLGNRGALAGAALIAVSPSVVTYSRRLLHDSLALVLTLGAVACFITALQNPANTPRGRWSRVGVVAFLTLFLATKANCFFIAAMLGAFYVAWWLSGIIEISTSITKWVPVGLFALVNAAAVALPRDNTFDKVIQYQQHRGFTIVALLSCLGFGLWLMTRPRDEAEAQSKKTALKNSDITTYVLTAATALWIYVLLFGGIAQVFIQWGHDPAHHFPKQTLLDGAQSARSAIHDMLAYWGNQQAEPRLPGRHDYYIVLALLYEVPVVLVALGGIWHAAKNRSLVTDLLLWWSFSSWTVYALANEKVPWLLVHSVLPLALLGGIWLGQVRWNKTVLGVCTVAGFLFAMRGVSGVNFERGGDHAEPMLYAQTPEAFTDALFGAIQNTRGDERQIWMAGEKQWPTIFYMRPNEPYMGKSTGAIGAKGAQPEPSNYRAAVVEDEAHWQPFAKAGWNGKTVDFLVWPRASWTALSPRRYWRWFFTRDTLPLRERKLSQNDWKDSILAGKGEWSSTSAVVGYPASQLR